MIFHQVAVYTICKHICARGNFFWVFCVFIKSYMSADGLYSLPLFNFVKINPFRHPLHLDAHFSEPLIKHLDFIVRKLFNLGTVSYTHLTLPTNREV